MIKIAVYITLLIAVVSCKNASIDENSGGRKNFDDTNFYSELFRIEEKQGYSVLSLRNPWQGSGDITLTYYISDFPDSIPPGADRNNIIITPVKAAVVMSTTHVAMIDRLGVTETIVGMSGVNYVSGNNLRKRIDLGLVKEIGYDNNLNNELIATLKPDIVFAYGIGAESAGYLSKLQESGIPVLYICDYLETDPLARAEWIRVFGLVYRHEKEADRIFNFTAGQYEIRRHLLESRIGERPVIMTGLPYKDTWFVSPGNSYISKIIWDAGGEYLWKNTVSDISMPMSLENVYVSALQSDIWINAGSSVTLGDIRSIDTRLADLPPVQTGEVYNNIKGTTSTGGNEYWESGVLSPHVILMDLASIFHPAQAPGYEPCFYIRLEDK